VRLEPTTNFGICDVDGLLVASAMGPSMGAPRWRLPMGVLWFVMVQAIVVSVANLVVARLQGRTWHGVVRVAHLV
jgi:hypothetical protein